MRLPVMTLMKLSISLSCAALPAAADELTVTAYYPKPRAAYGELRVENNARLANDNGNVAVGYQGQPGRVPLDINGYFTVSGALSIAEDAFGASPAWAVKNDTGEFRLLMQGGVGTDGTGVMTVIRSDKMGIGSFTPGAPPKNALDVKGRMLVGEDYAGQEQATTNGLAVEDRLSIGRNATDTPQQALEVAGAAVIGSGLAGVETAPAGGLLVQNRLGVGLSSAEDPINTLDVSGPVAIGPAYAVLASPAGTDLIVQNNIAATRSIVVTQDSLSGSERAFFGQSGAGPVGAGTWHPGAGVAAGAQTGGALGVVLLVGSGPGSNIFTAQSNGKVTAKDTLEIDASAKTIKWMPTASLLIPEAAPAAGAKKILVSEDAAGNASWKSPSAIAGLSGPNGSVTPAPPRSWNMIGSYQSIITRGPPPTGVLSEIACINEWGTGDCAGGESEIDGTGLGGTGSCAAGVPGTILFADYTAYSSADHAQLTGCFER